jgi:hypothetical protein
MTKPKSDRGSRDVCPSCKTRLRISMNAGEPSLEFDCPECEISLVASWEETTGVKISAVEDEVSTEATAQDQAARLIRKLPAKPRTIAAVITASLGLILAISFASTEGTPSTKSSLEETRIPADAAARRHNDSEAPGKSVAEVAIPVDPARDAELIVEVASPTSEQGNNDRSDSAANAGEIALAPPGGLIAKGGRESVKLVSADDETSGTDPAVSAVEQIASDVKGDLPESLVGKPLDGQSQQPKPKPMSVQERLGISIESFRQPKPVTLRELIKTVEQMCRVHVDVTAASPNLLSTEVTLSLKGTTPADILTEAGRKAGLRAIVDESSARMIPEDD